MTASPGSVNDLRFSKTFELPADPANGRTSPFKVAYADYGYRNDAHPEQEHVFLFFGSLLGSRLVHVAKDELARKHKIRIINPDRPGIGGTDFVDAKDSMKLWRKVIPALLQHLGIQHVSMGCHSGGTISALDILLHHPEILHPERSYLAIGGPWILPKHTGSTALSIAQSLPTRVIGSTDKLARLINNHIGPLLGVSFGLSYSLMAKLIPPPPPNQNAEVVEREGAKLEEQLWPHVIERIYAEGVRGISSDAVLLMQKSIGGWSDWGDYDTGVPRLAETLRAAGKTLRVDVFYAENDSLIGGEGANGPRWFDQCWEAGRCGDGDAVDYRSTTVKGADHDGIWNLRWGAVQTVFERISQSVQ